MKRGSPEHLDSLGRRISELESELATLSEISRRNAGFFEHSPLPLWVEDFRQVKIGVDRLRADGMRDLRSYLSRHPDVLLRLAGAVRIEDANHCALSFFQAKSKEDLRAHLNYAADKSSLTTFLDRIVMFSQRETTFVSEGVCITLAGKVRRVLYRLSLMPGFEDNWARAVLAVVDTPDIDRYMVELNESRDVFRRVFDRLSDAICLADRKTNIIIDANRQVEDLLGLYKEEIIGMRCSELYEQEERRKEGIPMSGIENYGPMRPTPVTMIHSSGRRVRALKHTRVVSLKDRELMLHCFKEQSAFRDESKRVPWVATHGLTSRERQVLALIAAGSSSREIAKKLCISHKTVETHRARIMKKLNLHKTAGLVRFALSTGLLGGRRQ